MKILETQNPLDISKKMSYTKKEIEKERKIVEALKAIEGIKRTLLGILKT